MGKGSRRLLSRTISWEPTVDGVVVYIRIGERIWSVRSYRTNDAEQLSSYYGHALHQATLSARTTSVKQKGWWT